MEEIPCEILEVTVENIVLHMMKKFEQLRIREKVQSQREC